MMQIDVLTLFPEMFEGVLKASILGRAAEQGRIEVRPRNIRDHTLDRHRKADDYPFGGGAGLVMMAQPVFDAVRAALAEGPDVPCRRIYLSPRGRTLDKQVIDDLCHAQRLLLLCGHYEGVDQRILDRFSFEEISIGDYILTGGELPAMVLIDAVARMLPGVLGNGDAHREESIYSGLLEYPQYTRPASFEDMDVPAVLTSGHHEAIHLWNYEQSLRLTARVRPDLLAAYLEKHRENKGVPPLTKKEYQILIQFLP